MTGSVRRFGRNLSDEGIGLTTRISGGMSTRHLERARRRTAARAMVSPSTMGAEDLVVEWPSDPSGRVAVGRVRHVGLG